MKIRINTTIREEEDKDWNADQPAADADKRPKCSDKKSEYKKEQNIYSHKRPSPNNNCIAHYSTQEVLDKGTRL